MNKNILSRQDTILQGLGGNHEAWTRARAKLTDGQGGSLIGSAAAGPLMAWKWCLITTPTTMLLAILICHLFLLFVQLKSSSIMNIFSSSTILPAVLLSGIDLSLSFLAHPRHRLSAGNVNAANVGGGGSSFAARRSKSKRLLFYHGERDLVERLIRTRGLAAPPSSSASYSDNNGYYGAAAVGTGGGGLSHEENRVVNTFTRASPAVAYIQTMISQEQIVQQWGFSLKGTEVPTGAGSGFLWDDKVSRIVCCFLFAPGGLRHRHLALCMH